MTKVPTSQTLFEYRGQRYSRHSGGDDYVRLQTNGSPSRDDFPDALEINEDPLDPWVKLPGHVISGRFSQEVTGMWHGVQVSIDQQIKRGMDRGKVVIYFAGTKLQTALEAGLSGNQNDGWSALVSPDEIEDVHVETTRLPPVNA